MSLRLTSRVSANKTFALYASYLYILTTSPATASSPYTEPLFAFLTCTGLYLVLPSRICKKSGASLVLSKIIGLVCLAAATGTRSLGILNTLVIAWQAFLQPIIQGDRRVSVSLHRRAPDTVKLMIVPCLDCDKARLLDCRCCGIHRTPVCWIPVPRVPVLLFGWKDNEAVVRPCFAVCLQLRAGSLLVGIS